MTLTSEQEIDGLSNARSNVW